MKPILIICLLLVTTVVNLESGCATGTTAPAATPSPSPIARTQGVDGIPASSNLPKIWRDFSSSANEAQIRRTAEILIAVIRQNLHSVHGVEVVRFANGKTSIWSEHGERFVWGPAPSIQPFKLPDMSKAPVGARMYQNEKDEYIANARAAYEGETARLLSEYNKRVDDQLERLQLYLLETPSEKAPCTKFKALRLRIEEENNPRNIVISDGWADCDDQTQPGDAVTFHGKIAVLMVTRTNDAQADDQEFYNRKAYLKNVFPGAVVVSALSSEIALRDILN